MQIYDELYWHLFDRKYCLQACAVDDPEVKFNVDQYSDVTMITKPVIYISVQEVVNTHQVGISRSGDVS